MHLFPSAILNLFFYAYHITVAFLFFLFYFFLAVLISTFSLHTSLLHLSAQHFIREPQFNQKSIFIQHHHYGIAIHTSLLPVDGGNGPVCHHISSPSTKGEKATSQLNKHPIPLRKIPDILQMCHWIHWCVVRGLLASNEQGDERVVQHG